ncbi:hypothetical protein FOA52_001814 [Chlamydomonas sp. UWO 241]|nr:hypothetical protein FOA52_001814 [Chlamydomonas sp. UWO 241]
MPGIQGLSPNPKPSCAELCRRWSQATLAACLHAHDIAEISGCYVDATLACVAEFRDWLERRSGPSAVACVRLADWEFVLESGCVSDTADVLLAYPAHHDSRHAPPGQQPGSSGRAAASNAAATSSSSSSSGSGASTGAGAHTPNPRSQHTHASTQRAGGGGGMGAYLSALRTSALLASSLPNQPLHLSPLHIEALALARLLLDGMRTGSVPDAVHVRLLDQLFGSSQPGLLLLLSDLLSSASSEAEADPVGALGGSGMAAVGLLRRALDVTCRQSLRSIERMNVADFLGSTLPSHAALCCLLHAARAVPTLAAWSRALTAGPAHASDPRAAEVSEACAAFIAAMARAGSPRARHARAHGDPASEAAAAALGVLLPPDIPAAGDVEMDVSLMTGPEGQRWSEGRALLSAADVRFVTERMGELLSSVEEAVGGQYGYTRPLAELPAKTQGQMSELQHLMESMVVLEVVADMEHADLEAAVDYLLRACAVLACFARADLPFFCRASDAAIPPLRAASRRLVAESSALRAWWRGGGAPPGDVTGAACPMPSALPCLERMCTSVCRLLVAMVRARGDPAARARLVVDGSVAASDDADGRGGTGAGGGAAAQRAQAEAAEAARGLSLGAAGGEGGTGWVGGGARPLRDSLSDFWRAHGRDADGLPLLEAGGGGPEMGVREVWEAVLEDLLQLLTRILVDAVLPAHSADASDTKGPNTGVPIEVATLLDTLSVDGLPGVLAWVFSNDTGADVAYSQYVAGGAGGAGGGRHGRVTLRDVDRLRVCAAQLLRTLLACRPQAATHRPTAFALRAARRFLCARVQLRVLNSYCVDTLLTLSRVLLPVPRLAAEMASLDLAPLAGDMKNWVPNATKTLGSALCVLHLWPPFSLLLRRLLPYCAQSQQQPGHATGGRATWAAGLSPTVASGVLSRAVGPDPRADLPLLLVPPAGNRPGGDRGPTAPSGTAHAPVTGGVAPAAGSLPTGAATAGERAAARAREARDAAVGEFAARPDNACERESSSGLPRASSLARTSNSGLSSSAAATAVAAVAADWVGSIEREGSRMEPALEPGDSRLRGAHALQQRIPHGWRASLPGNPPVPPASEPPGEGRAGTAAALKRNATDVGRAPPDARPMPGTWHSAAGGGGGAAAAPEAAPTGRDRSGSSVAATGSSSGGGADGDGVVAVRYGVGGPTHALFNGLLQQLQLLLTHFDAMEPMQVAIDMVLDYGGVCELLLLVLTQGHYTLSARADLEDPAFAVLLAIAEEMEARPENLPASQLKRRLSTARLASALEASRDARALDRSHGVRGLPLLSLEELLCVVLLACRRPQLAAKLAAIGALDALHTCVDSVFACAAPGEVARGGVLLLGAGSVLRAAAVSIAVYLTEVANEKLGQAAERYLERVPTMLKKAHSASTPGALAGCQPTRKPDLSIGELEKRCVNLGIAVNASDVRSDALVAALSVAPALLRAAGKLRPPLQVGLVLMAPDAASALLAHGGRPTPGGSSLGGTPGGGSSAAASPGWRGGARTPAAAARAGGSAAVTAAALSLSLSLAGGGPTAAARPAASAPATPAPRLAASPMAARAAAAAIGGSPTGTAAHGALPTLGAAVAAYRHSAEFSAHAASVRASAAAMLAMPPPRLRPTASPLALPPHSTHGLSPPGGSASDPMLLAMPPPPLRPTASPPASPPHATHGLSPPGSRASNPSGLGAGLARSTPPCHDDDAAACAPLLTRAPGLPPPLPAPPPPPALLAAHQFDEHAVRSPRGSLSLPPRLLFGGGGGANSGGGPGDASAGGDDGSDAADSPRALGSASPRLLLGVGPSSTLRRHLARITEDQRSAAGLDAAATPEELRAAWPLEHCASPGRSGSPARGGRVDMGACSPVRGRGRSIYDGPSMVRRGGAGMDLLLTPDAAATTAEAGGDIGGDSSSSLGDAALLASSSAAAAAGTEEFSVRAPPDNAAPAAAAPAAPEEAPRSSRFATEAGTLVAATGGAPAAATSTAPPTAGAPAMAAFRGGLAELTVSPPSTTADASLQSPCARSPTRSLTRSSTRTAPPPLRTAPASNKSGTQQRPGPPVSDAELHGAPHAASLVAPSGKDATVALDPDGLASLLTSLAEAAPKLRVLGGALSALPRPPLSRLCREPALLGCGWLACGERRGGDAWRDEAEGEGALMPCGECGGPRYCSDRCAEADGAAHHWAACMWALERPQRRAP